MKNGDGVCHGVRETDCHLHKLGSGKAQSQRGKKIMMVNSALEAVDQKLQKRYPNGYTPEASVNRLV
jgi:hypothetical protein